MNGLFYACVILGLIAIVVSLVKFIQFIAEVRKDKKAANQILKNQLEHWRAENELKKSRRIEIID